MLLITEKRRDGVLTFKLAGSLTRDWATELDRCWHRAKTTGEVLRVTVDLTDVIFVDEPGKELLSSMMREGAELIASDVLMRSIVEEIAKESSIAGIQ